MGAGYTSQQTHAVTELFFTAADDIHAVQHTLLQRRYPYTAVVQTVTVFPHTLQSRALPLFSVTAHRVNLTPSQPRSLHLRELRLCQSECHIRAKVGAKVVSDGIKVVSKGINPYMPRYIYIFNIKYPDANSLSALTNAGILQKTTGGILKHLFFE